MLHRNIWALPDGKSNIGVDRIWHSYILDVKSFRGAEFDTDHYLMVAEVRERLCVSKRKAQTLGGDCV